MSRSKQSQEKARQLRERFKSRQKQRTGTVFTLTPPVAKEPESRRPVGSEAVGLPKLSDQIGELIKPILANPNVPPEYALSLGIAAWNIATAPKESRLSMTANLLINIFPAYATRIRACDGDHEKLMESTDPKEIELFSVLLMIVQKLVEKKLELYPDDHRRIVNHTSERRDGKFCFTIASNVPPEMLNQA